MNFHGLSGSEKHPRYYQRSGLRRPRCPGVLVVLPLPIREESSDWRSLHI
jgi:hypothetical protein